MGQRRGKKVPATNFVILSLPVSNSKSVTNPALYPDVAAVLLAGGHSRRMGYDKALLSLGEQPIVQVLAMRLHELTNQVLLSANDPSAYAFLGLRTIPDIYPSRGPLAGLHAAMLHTLRPLVLVLACDLPCVSTTLLRHMIECSAGFDIVIPVTSDGCLHPVCAVYRRTCQQSAEHNLSVGENRMLSLLEDPRLRTRRLSSLEGAFSDADLTDLNSPEDLEKYRRLSKP
jgi:molybdopterin-guanine dinucleotide biosynthesis protein A